MSLSVGVIIRFHYERNDPRFSWRFEYFRRHVLPRLKQQAYDNFEIWIRCNEWHRPLFESLGLNTFYIQNEVVKYKQSKNGNKRFFHDFVPYEMTVGLPKFDVQFGLDSDDLISEQYIMKVMKTIIDQDLTKSIHVCYQPELLYWKTGVIKPLRQYSTNRGSAFMALYQPRNYKYRFIYDESHISIIKKADIRIVLPRGECFASVHDFNESTGK